jgi:hypothetical protein
LRCRGSSVSIRAAARIALAPFEKAQAAYRQGDLAAAERLAGPLADQAGARTPL